MSTGAITVTGVDFVTLPVKDLDAARAFYADVLGLPPGPVWQRGDGPALGAEFETGNLTISVVDAGAVGMDSSPSRQPIALRVDDVAAAREALEARGVAFPADTIDSGVCHMAFFADPDGNALMLHHRYAPREPTAGT
jgi:catechol 2,3-dioxygenase-like lactoylglutathione lyase family enzyme